MKANPKTEQSLHRGNEKKFSRRTFFGALAGTAIAGMAGRQLPKEISFNKPPLDIQEVYVGRMNNDIQLLSKTISEEDGSESILTLTPEGKLLFEPYGEFFDPDKPMNYVHRGGNDIPSIDKVCEKANEENKEGPLILDVDANVVERIVYADHGIVPQLKVTLGSFGLNLYVPAVFDVNEQEVKLGMPNTFDEIVAHVASLSTDKRPLALSVELKRGDFDLLVMHEMFASLKKYKVPALMHSLDPRQFDAIRSEIASR